MTYLGKKEASHRRDADKKPWNKEGIFLHFFVLPVIAIPPLSYACCTTYVLRFARRQGVIHLAFLSKLGSRQFASA